MVRVLYMHTILVLISNVKRKLHVVMDESSMWQKRKPPLFFRPLQVYLIDVFITIVDLFCQPTSQFQM